MNTKFKEAEDSRNIGQNKLHKSCFQHDMAYEEFKDLPKRAVSDQALRDKAFNIAKNPKYEGHQRGITPKIYKFFNKKYSGDAIENEITPNQQLAEELQKPTIRNFEKRKAHSRQYFGCCSSRHAINK